MSTRVAITGVGLVTALGVTREESWRRMLAGECGICATTIFDTEGYRSRVAAEVDIDGVDEGSTPLERRRRSRSDRIGVRAAVEALADARVLDGPVDRSRVGVFFGAGTADLLRNEDFYRTWITAGLHRTRRSDAWNHFPSTPVDVVAEKFGFEGPRGCIVAACSSSTIAIGRGVESIRRGHADVVLAGGTDALSRLTYSGFNLLRLMDPAPCRPFDRSRAGMNIGEGAGILVLEDLERARRRGAPIYAELAGHGLACEAFHPTAPEPEGKPVAAVIHLALRDAGISPDEVQHINAHGTATSQNDSAEARGFRRVFGDRIDRIPVTSIKSMIGHCLGASGAV
ncbi:MAG TPA: beta-ketoacyl-[acyl-carrier-protein] synthase family protein, partial [Vicinamibacterales bacterium]|nr:beta-ketoacyl-[acyl-carrier-protein] synthase family protein [Vicinamibacterales bacterium]